MQASLILDSNTSYASANDTTTSSLKLISLSSNLSSTPANMNKNYYSPPDSFTSSSTITKNYLKIMV